MQSRNYTVSQELWFWGELRGFFVLGFWFFVWVDFFFFSVGWFFCTWKSYKSSKNKGYADLFYSGLLERIRSILFQGASENCSVPIAAVPVKESSLNHGLETRTGGAWMTELTGSVCPVWKFSFCTPCSFPPQNKVDSLLITGRSSWSSFFTSFGILIKNLDKIYWGPLWPKQYSQGYSYPIKEFIFKNVFWQRKLLFPRETLKLLVPLRLNCTRSWINAPGLWISSVCKEFKPNPGKAFRRMSALFSCILSN